MSEKIFEWDQVSEGNFLRISWEELKYDHAPNVFNHWVIKPQFIVVKVVDKGYRALDCEVYFPNDKEFFREVQDLIVKNDTVEIDIRNKISIPKSAFAHLVMSKKARTDALVKDKDPMVYTKIQKLKPSDVLIYEI